MRNSDVISYITFKYYFDPTFGNIDYSFLICSFNTVEKHLFTELCNTIKNCLLERSTIGDQRSKDGREFVSFRFKFRVLHDQLFRIKPLTRNNVPITSLLVSSCAMVQYFLTHGYLSR